VVGLTADEAFLVALKRMGDLDTLTRKFAREHSGRLWKQLVLRSEDPPARLERWQTSYVPVFAVWAVTVVVVLPLLFGFS
jgi:hypothetical protein